MKINTVRVGLKVPTKHKGNQKGNPDEPVENQNASRNREAKSHVTTPNNSITIDKVPKPKKD